MRRAGRARACAGAAALATLLATPSGCSWIFTKPLSENASRFDYPDCSTNPAPPLIDTVVSLSNLGAAIYIDTQENVSAKDLRIATSLVAAGIWMASAVYGYSKTGACRAAIGDHDHGYHPVPFGTGGEVFAPSPAPPAASPADDEDPQHPRSRPRPAPATVKPDAPRSGN